MQWWSLLALADLFVLNRPHTHFLFLLLPPPSLARCDRLGSLGSLGPARLARSLGPARLARSLGPATFSGTIRGSQWGPASAWPHLTSSLKWRESPVNHTQAKTRGELPSPPPFFRRRTRPGRQRRSGDRRRRGVQAGVLVRPPPLSAVPGLRQHETTESIHVRLPGGWRRQWRGRQKQDHLRAPCARR